MKPRRQLRALHPAPHPGLLCGPLQTGRLERNQPPQTRVGRVEPVGNGLAWSPLSLLLLVLLICACRSPVEPIVPDMTAQRIVFRYAETAFAVAFDTSEQADRTALEQFRQTTASASSRTDLQRAWVAIPTLAAQGADFLETRVFARAARDADWPSAGPPDDEKSVYVDAVRMAAKSFLAEEPEDQP